MKWDYQWILGYDTSAIDSHGNAILINFNTSSPEISLIETIDNFWMEGANTSFSNDQGNLKFYSNGCNIISANNQIMENGSNINPGVVEEFWCPFGGSPLPQSLISLNVPSHPDLAFVFNLDLGFPYLNSDTFTANAPEKLLYNLVDIEANNGAGNVLQKNVVLYQDTFARGTLQAVQHQNKNDWWLIIPKSHSNCYFLFLISEETIHEPLLRCVGTVWNDNDAGQSVFSPNGTIYARFNYQNGLNIFNFDNELGILSEIAHIDFTTDNFPSSAGVAISSNSKYLYVTAGHKIYQFDLTNTDIESTKSLVAESESSDGSFNLAALAPDKKIYISGTGSSNFLHVINFPDCPGLESNIQIKGLKLPSFNYLSIPNFPHYRYDSQEINCDSIVGIDKQENGSLTFRFYPNPFKDYLIIESISTQDMVNFSVIDLYGKVRFTSQFQFAKSTTFDLSFLESGIYIAQFHSNNLFKSVIISKVE